MRHEPPEHDEPMVISIEVAEYKVERVLIDQGSSANILYWSTYLKLGLRPIDMAPSVGKLYGFTDKQVEIRGVMELETTFGERNHARTIQVCYTIVDVEASYNIIMGRPALNKLGAVVSTYLLCMKYSVGKEVGKIWVDHHVARKRYEDSLRIGLRPAQINRPNVNVLDLDMDPRCDDERERPSPTEDLKEVTIDPNSAHKTKMGTAMTQEEENHLTAFL
ncbi:hypothetical protein CR513_30001, partial [Mucuna pruriens]